jgi:hypothetical protein
MKISKLLMLITVFAIAMSACKKKDQSRADLLVSKAWKYADFGEDLNNNGVLEASESDILNCDKDDSYTFASGGSGTFDEGASKCNASDPQTSQFNWQLIEGETKLIVTGTSVIIPTATIKTMDNSNLVLAYEFLGSKYIAAFKR